MCCWVPSLWQALKDSSSISCTYFSVGTGGPLEGDLYGRSVLKRSGVNRSDDAPCAGVPGEEGCSCLHCFMRISAGRWWRSTSSKQRQRRTNAVSKQRGRCVRPHKTIVYSTTSSFIVISSTPTRYVSNSRVSLDRSISDGNWGWLSGTVLEMLLYAVNMFPIVNCGLYRLMTRCFPVTPETVLFHLQFL